MLSAQYVCVFTFHFLGCDHHKWRCHNSQAAWSGTPSSQDSVWISSATGWGSRRWHNFCCYHRIWASQECRWAGPTKNPPYVCYQWLQTRLQVGCTPCCLWWLKMCFDSIGRKLHNKIFIHWKVIQSNGFQMWYPLFEKVDFFSLFSSKSWYNTHSIRFKVI